MANKPSEIDKLIELARSPATLAPAPGELLSDPQVAYLLITGPNPTDGRFALALKLLFEDRGRNAATG